MSLFMMHRIIIKYIFDSNQVRRLLVFTIAVLYFNACFDSKKNEFEIILLQDTDEYKYELPYQEIITSQDTGERIWKEAGIQLLKNQSDSLYSPVRIVIKDGLTFALDPVDGYIKKIDHQTAKMVFLGQGKGNGPGEVNFPFDFDIDPLGNFIVLDIAKKALITLDSQGEPLDSYQFRSASPTTLSIIDERLAIVMINGSLHGNPSETDGLFQLYDRETKELSLFSDFLSGRQNLPPLNGLEMAFTGTILNDHQHLIFLPKHINQIIRIDQNGEIIYARKTVDKSELPVVTSSVNGASLSSESKTALLNGFLIGNDIIIWSKTGITKYGGHVFDFYDQSTGDYKYSVNIPELGAVTGLAMGSEIISTINIDGSVSVWSFEVP